MMSFIEFIVFIASMILFVFLSQKQMRERRRYLESEGELDDEDNRQKVIRELMTSLNMTYEEAEAFEDELGMTPNTPPPPPKSPAIKKVKSEPKTKRTLSDQYKLQTKLEKRHLHSKIEKSEIKSTIERRYEEIYKPVVSEGWSADSVDNPYAIRHEENESKAAKLLRQGNSKKKMILYKEILGKPKALSK
ncbi:MAG: hypothetical protein VX777_05105 [Chlamydiota bacterium]|nr:hypothetical protein [Chlamydiota bacterium]